MKIIGKIFSLGITTALLIMVSQSFVMVLFNIADWGKPLSVVDIPFYCQVWLLGLFEAAFSYFVPSILGAALLIGLARAAEYKWMGFAAGIVVGILIDIPYFLLSTFSYGGLKFPFDTIVLIIPIPVCVCAGLYAFYNNSRHVDKKNENFFENKPSFAQRSPLEMNMVAAQPQNQTPSDTPKSSHQFKPYWLLSLSILIPPLILMGLCIVSLVLYACFTLTPYSLADSLWSYRISQKLKEKGFTPEKVNILRDKHDNNLSHLDIQIGIAEVKEYQEYQDVIKAVHRSVFEALDMPFFTPRGVGKINVSIDDERVGHYHISVDYDIAHKYYLGTSIPGEYIQSWRFY